MTLGKQVVSALVKKDADGYGQGIDYRGLVNTAWTRVTVGLKVTIRFPMYLGQYI